MTTDQLHTKLESIERRTKGFSAMNVLTIVMIVGGIILGYCDRDKAIVVDNSKQYSQLSAGISSLKDSLSLFKLELTDAAQLNHQETNDRITNIEAQIRAVTANVEKMDSRVKRLETGYVIETHTKYGTIATPVTR